MLCQRRIITTRERESEGTEHISEKHSERMGPDIEKVEAVDAKFFNTCYLD